MTKARVITHDFGDGNGPVPAHRHPNGGGWVADTAGVASGVFVGKDALVYEDAEVLDQRLPPRGRPALERVCDL
jgi:hypothetical protein